METVHGWLLLCVRAPWRLRLALIEIKEAGRPPKSHLTQSNNPHVTTLQKAAKRYPDPGTEFHVQDREELLEN